MGLDFLPLGKSALFELRKHEFSINSNLEPTTAVGDDRQLLQVEFLCSQDLFRQTDGLGDIPSTGAVLDFDTVRQGQLLVRGG
tara:strand:+ start:137 stop:385 length:249 start_codon:yes stop_codon:yes gene_type:complete